MQMPRTFNIFICHTYSDREHYSELVDKLNGVKRFDWQNLSVPYDMRIRNKSDDDLHAAIRERISQSDVVLAFTTVAMSHKDWIKEELSIATAHSKPIVAITRFKKGDRSAVVINAAAAHVDNWRIEKIVEAIKHVAVPTGHVVNPAVISTGGFIATGIERPPLFHLKRREASS
jgi:Thoeris protein ThsB, TIR-like domain